MKRVTRSSRKRAIDLIRKPEPENVFDGSLDEPPEMPDIAPWNDSLDFAIPIEHIIEERICVSCGKNFFKFGRTGLFCVECFSDRYNFVVDEEQKYAFGCRQLKIGKRRIRNIVTLRVLGPSGNGIELPAVIIHRGVENNVTVELCDGPAELTSVPIARDVWRVNTFTCQLYDLDNDTGRFYAVRGYHAYILRNQELDHE